jgi:Tol biopolymer transport system component
MHSRKQRLVKLLFWICLFLLASLIQSCEKDVNTPVSSSEIESNRLYFSYYTVGSTSILFFRGVRCDLTTSPVTLTIFLPGATCLRVNSMSTEITYDSNPTGSLDIFRSSIDGSGIVDLTPDPQSQFMDSNPEWSPNGEHISFTRYFNKKSREAVMWMNRDGSDIRFLTDTSQLSTIIGASWSPNGKSIAVCAIPIDGGSNYRFYTLDSSGANLTLRDSHVFAVIPRYSPDGSLIAYGSSAGLAVYNVANGTIIPISISGTMAFAFSFKWRPNGTLICSAQNAVTSKYDIYVVTIGATVTSSVLATGFGSDFSVASSSNGQSVALLGVAASDTLLSLYTVDTNGANFKKITTVDTDKSSTSYPENGMFWIN